MKHLSLLTALILLLSACGAPTDSTTPTFTDYPPIPDNPITEEESALASTVNNPAEDGVEPWSNIDGDSAEMAPQFGEPTPDGMIGSDTVQRAFAIQNCRVAQGYRAGRPYSICVVTVQGKLVEVHTAEAFTRMATAARGAGANLVINSGFRTMDQQRYLYSLYRMGRGNLAAVPGFSNHQSGLALDLGTGQNWWLDAHAATYGFHRTVASENWHWEWNGTGVVVQPHNDGCTSATLGYVVATDTCVQARSDRQWYTCGSDGVWQRGMLRCARSYPLTVVNPINRPITCYSTTLRRDVPVGTCVRNQYDHQPYVCGHPMETTTGWLSAPGRC